MQPNPDLQRKRQLRLLVVIGIIIIVAIVALIVGLGSHKKSTQPTKTASNSTTSYDANSGETVHTIKGEHGNTGTSSDTPLFLGTSELLNAGLTTDQLTNVETAFYRYSSTQTSPIQQVSITAGSAQTRIVNPNTANQAFDIDFTVVLDGNTKLNAAVQYSGFETIDLTLYDASGAKVYDSGVIDTSSSAGD